MKENRRTDAMKIKDQLMNLCMNLLVIHSTSLMIAKAESRFHTMSKRTRMPWIKGGGGIKHVLHRMCLISTVLPHLLTVVIGLLTPMICLSIMLCLWVHIIDA